ncbi:MAG: hypothetical protein Q9159_006825 [Coniocarpon cinnabarinum]
MPHTPVDYQENQANEGRAMVRSQDADHSPPGHESQNSSRHKKITEIIKTSATLCPTLSECSASGLEELMRNLEAITDAHVPPLLRKMEGRSRAPIALRIKSKLLWLEDELEKFTDEELDKLLLNMQEFLEKNPVHSDSGYGSASEAGSRASSYSTDHRSPDRTTKQETRGGAPQHDDTLAAPKSNAKTKQPQNKAGPNTKTNEKGAEQTSKKEASKPPSKDLSIQSQADKTTPHSWIHYSEHQIKLSRDVPRLKAPNPVKFLFADKSKYQRKPASFLCLHQRLWLGEALSEIEYSKHSGSREKLKRQCLPIVCYLRGLDGNGGRCQSGMQGCPGALPKSPDDCDALKKRWARLMPWAQQKIGLSVEEKEFEGLMKGPTNEKKAEG